MTGKYVLNSTLDKIIATAEKIRASVDLINNQSDFDNTKRLMDTLCSQVSEIPLMFTEDLYDFKGTSKAITSNAFIGDSGSTSGVIAYSIADRYISVYEVDDGYDYSIIGPEFKEIDGGVYDDPNVSIETVLEYVVEELVAAPNDNPAKGSIKAGDKLVPVDYDKLTNSMELKEQLDHLFEDVSKSIETIEDEGGLNECMEALDKIKQSLKDAEYVYGFPNWSVNKMKEIYRILLKKYYAKQSDIMY